MKNKLLALLFIAALIVSCGNREQKHPTQSIDPSATIRELALGDYFLDVDLDSLSAATMKAMEANQPIVQGLPNRIAQAAAYRFMKQVKFVDNKYVVSVTSGEEIGISDRIFKAMNEGISGLNNMVETLKATNPDDVFLFDIEPELIEGLLEPIPMDTVSAQQ